MFAFCIQNTYLFFYFFVCKMQTCVHIFLLHKPIRCTKNSVFYTQLINLLHAHFLPKLSFKIKQHLFMKPSITLSTKSSDIIMLRGKLDHCPKSDRTVTICVQCLNPRFLNFLYMSGSNEIKRYREAHKLLCVAEKSGPYQLKSGRSH